MTSAAIMSHTQETTPNRASEAEKQDVQTAIRTSWAKVAPFWPLENLIAVNPLQGLESLPFGEALHDAEALFEQADLPPAIQQLNRLSMKWLQAYFDEGQATIAMPLRHYGLFAAWRQLARFDRALHRGNKMQCKWLESLPTDPETVIAECLLKLSIPREDRSQFLTLLLTTLPGWSAHIKYRTEWAPASKQTTLPVTQADYLAMRLVSFCLIGASAEELLQWHRAAQQKAQHDQSRLSSIQQAEEAYRTPLLSKLSQQSLPDRRIPDAQLVFCIDVRSEPFRRRLEATGDYETLGFAGFFGVPVQVNDAVTGESYASCPVLLKPAHEVTQAPSCGSDACEKDRRGHARKNLLRQFYQSLKYNFATPFALVETMGAVNGLWMGLKSIAPSPAFALKAAITSAIRQPVPVATSLDGIPMEDRCRYGEGALRMMGLTSHFAPIVVLCGHGSTTQNNAYATSLDCGACGGRHGANNARVLADILNDAEVRAYLDKQGISIPRDTRFIAGEHDTTTDAVTLFDDPQASGASLRQLQDDLVQARQANSFWRAQTMGVRTSKTQGAKHTCERSQDWAQVRPEWGLARNAAFIVGPRSLTNRLDLEGRCFLHSYDWQQDEDSSSLTVILTAPMVVAQWINTQYLFSTLNNVAYGGGSKVTKNITGKIGIIQGNASDLMHGLPLQSVYASDTDAYHEPQRLMTVVYAPREKLDLVIAAQPVLQNLFGNGWVNLACVEPQSHETFMLQPDLTWAPTQALPTSS